MTFLVENLKHKLLGPLSFELAMAAGHKGAPHPAILAIMGASGAGKTLLLRAIADLDPSAGRVVLAGQKRCEMSAVAWRRQVAYVPAEAGWWADKVGEHFEALHELNPEQEFEEPDFTAVGLSQDVMNWSVSRLSTGEKQRLALLRALVLKPKLILLDEPCSALDEETGRAVEELILRHCEAGMMALIVTHDKAQAARLAGRRLIMEAGGILKNDPNAGGAL